METVLFLGAGFSKAFGYPVMDEFFPYAARSRWLSAEQKESLVELRVIASRSDAGVTGKHDNLEHVFSVASMSRPSAEDEQFRRVLQRVFAVKPDACQLKKCSHDMALLLKNYVGDGPRDGLTIVTTNYDLMAEFALVGQVLAPRLPFAWNPLAENARVGDLYSDRDDHPLICKLHGSLNWYAPADDNETVEVADAIVRLQGEPVSVDNKFNWPTVGQTRYESPRAPLLVPPTFFKERRNRLDPVWESAGNALRRAQQIVFIGYSFPASDYHMAYFLGAAIAENGRLEQIEIVDPNAKAIINAFEAEPYGNKFRQLVRNNDERCWQDGYTIAV